MWTIILRWQFLSDSSSSASGEDIFVFHEVMDGGEGE